MCIEVSFSQNLRIIDLGFDQSRPHPSRRTQNQPTLSTNHPHAIGYRNGVLAIVAVHSSCNSLTWMNEHWVFLWLLQLVKSMVWSSSNSLIRCMGIQFFVDFVQFVHSSYDNIIVDDEIIVFFQFSIFNYFLNSNFKLFILSIWRLTLSSYGMSTPVGMKVLNTSTWLVCEKG